MADVQSWQRQSMRKDGACEPAASKSDGKSVYPMGKTAQMNPKIAAPTYGLGNLASANMKKPKVYMADGGDVTEAADKEAGLAASSGEKVGFFERLRMGNIDDPGSEAYRRLGAGRGREDRAEVIRIANRAAAAEESRNSSSSGNGAFLGADEDMAPAPKMTASDAKRETKDFETTPVAIPRPARPKSDVMRSSAGKPPSAAATSGEAQASEPQGRTTGDDARRVDTANQSANTAVRTGVSLTSEGRGTAGRRAPYETPYDRMNRLNREKAAAESAASEVARKAEVEKRPDLQALAKNRTDRMADIVKARDEARAKDEAEEKRFNSLSPAERSMERGRKLKEFLGLGGK